MAIVQTKNGVLRDTETNRFVKGGKPTTAIVTSSQGREMQARRYELARDRIRKAVLDEVKSISDIPADTPEDAYAFVVAKQTVALIDSDKPRMDDVEKLGHLMGTVEHRRDKQETDKQMSPLELAMASLIDAVTSKVRQSGVDVVDAETTE